MALDVGTLTARLGLDVSGVRQGSQQAQQELQNVERRGEQTGKRLGAVGDKIKGALAVGAVVAFGKASIDAFTEAEQSSLKLQHAFETFPKLADTNVSAIEDMASALAKKTRFDDDATKSAAAQLAQFNLTGKEIEKILPLVQDYAARTGKELPDAATSLGKAVLGQTRSLKEVGINYKSTGDQAKDFANITDLLAQKVGGFAEQQGKTAAGRAEILANRFGELKESVGEALIPALGLVQDVLGPVIDLVAAGATQVGGLIETFKEAPAPVKVLVGVLGGLALLKFTGLGSRVAGLVAGMKQQWATATYDARTFAGQVNAINLRRQAGEMGAFGAAARTTGAGLKSFGSVLLGAVGGPGGLLVTGAIGALTFGLSKLSQSQQETAERTQQMQQNMVELKDTINSVTGAMSNLTVTKLAQQLQGMDGDLRKAGSSAAEMAAAIVAGGKPLDDFLLKVTRGSEAMGAFWSGSLLSDEDMTKLFQPMQKLGVSWEEVSAAALAGGEVQAQMVQKLSDATGLSQQYIADSLNSSRKSMIDAIPVLGQVADNYTNVTNTARITAETFKTVASSLAQSLNIDPTKFVQGLMDGQAAGKTLDDTLKGMSITGPLAQQVVQGLADVSGGFAQKAGDAAAGAEKLDTATVNLSTNISAAEEAQTALNDEVSAAEQKYQAAKDKLTPMAQASQDAADAQSELADQTGRVTDALDRQAGRVATTEEANARASEASDRMAEAFKLGTAEAQRLGASILNTDGSIKTAGESGRTLRDNVLGVREAMVSQAAAAAQSAAANGNLKGAQDEARKAAQGTYDEFIKNATAILGTKGAAEQLAKAYGLVPDQVATQITADNKDGLAKAAAVKKAGQELEDKKRTQKLLGDYTDAMKKINAVDQKKLDPKTAKVVAATKQALADLGAVDKTSIKGKKVQVDAAVKAAREALAAVKADVEGLPNASRTISYKYGVDGKSGGGGGGGSSAAKARAKGGMVYGPGTGTSDSILTWLSNGEGVNTAKAMSHAANRRAMDFMNAGGVIPGFAEGGLVSNVKYTVKPDGSIDFGKLATAAGDAMMGAAKKSLDALVPKVPAASSAGVEQWRALALKVAADKGFPPSSVQIMLNQMTRESSGNPAAINLYDINARRGTPSKGLLQFIDPTFRAYADPGYNRNIWDPESQMRAWYNYVPARYGSLDYLTRIGYGAYATGGLVRGPGTGRSDSILARLSNGEGINTAAAMRHAPNRKAMEFMNAGGIIPGFADGGMVRPFDLAGLTRSTPGERQGNTLSAQADLAEWVKAFRQVASELTSAANDSAKAAAQNRGALRSLSAESKRRVYEAKVEAQAVVRSAEASLRAARAAVTKTAADRTSKDRTLEAARAAMLSANATRDEAKARLRSAGAGKTRAAAQKALDAAQAAAEKRQKAYTDALSRSRTATVSAKEAASLAVRTERSLDIIRRQQANAVAKVVAEEKRRVGTASAEQKALDQRATRDRKAADAARSKAAAEERAYRATARARSVLTQLAAQYDKTTEAMRQGANRLDNLRDLQQNMRESVRDRIAGFGDGILGHSEQRRTGADLLRGLQYNGRKISSFTGDLARARRLGINADLLEQIAQAGVDGGATTARALATSSRSMVARINAAAKANFAMADRAGVTVAQASYQRSIDQQAASNRQLGAKLDRTNALLGRLAGDITKGVASNFRGVSNRGLLQIVDQAQRELRRR